jgi:hypothetical protein
LLDNLVNAPVRLYSGSSNGAFAKAFPPEKALRSGIQYRGISWYFFGQAKNESLTARARFFLFLLDNNVSIAYNTKKEIAGSWKSWLSFKETYI